MHEYREAGEENLRIKYKNDNLWAQVLAGGFEYILPDFVYIGGDFGE